MSQLTPGASPQVPSSALLPQTRVCQPKHYGYTDLDHSPWWNCPVHCRVLNSIPGLRPPDASNKPLLPAEATKTAPRHCQVYPGGQNCHWLTITVLDLSYLDFNS